MKKITHHHPISRFCSALLPNITLVLVLAITSSGCATIFSGGSRSFNITTERTKKPVSVTVTTPASSYLSTLPTTVISKPSSFKPVSIQVNDPCYESTSVVIGKRTTLTFWANIIFPMLPGLLIDYLSGAMWHYDAITYLPLTPKTGVKDCPTR